MRVALAFLLCLCLAGVSDAKPAPTAPPTVDQRAKCLGYTATILSRLKAMIEADAAYELHEYSGDRAAKVLATFNSKPPETHFTADRIMALVDTGEGGKVMVMFLTANCITKVIAAPRDGWATILKEAIGVDT